MPDYFNTGPSRFVFNKVDELRPSGVSYGFSKVMILDHAFDIQGFQADGTEAINDLATELVAKVEY